MGPAPCKASKSAFIAYTIITLLIILQIKYTKASPLPKTTIPPLKGISNYKCWSNLVKNSLIVLGIWYAVSNGKPDKEYEKFVDKPATETKKEIYHWGTTILNCTNILKWTEDNTKAMAYISLFATPIAEQHINDRNTSQHNWKTLKDKYSTHGAMVTFHSL
jgi:hypothetical protein